LNNNYQREIHIKLMRGLLDIIILQYLYHESMHGYQLINEIRRKFDIYFGPSEVYPLLRALEKRGYVKSTWRTGPGRTKKMYELTKAGKNALKINEDSFNRISITLSVSSKIQRQATLIMA
jgi:PadR family transcriptional regulator